MKQMQGGRNGFHVLNHGHVALVSFMQPDRPDAQWTPDTEVVRNARVSYNNVRSKGEENSAAADAKLIGYLLKNRHTSPFEAMVFTFDIKCPIFVARQWHRHRTWAYSEVSARYSELPEEFYIPEEGSIGMQSKDNKQMRDLVLAAEDVAGFERKQRDSDAVSLIRASCEGAFRSYHALLEAGVPRELARGVLPMNTYTHFFGTVNLNNFLKFIDLRDDAHAQPEIRVYAQAMLSIISEICYETIGHYKRLRDERN